MTRLPSTSRPFNAYLASSASRGSLNSCFYGKHKAQKEQDQSWKACWACHLTRRTCLNNSMPSQECVHVQWPLEKEKQGKGKKVRNYIQQRHSLASYPHHVLCINRVHKSKAIMTHVWKGWWYFAPHRWTKHHFEIVAISIKTRINIIERLAKSTNEILSPQTSRFGKSQETFNKIIQVKPHGHLEGCNILTRYKFHFKIYRKEWIGKGDLYTPW